MEARKCKVCEQTKSLTEFSIVKNRNGRGKLEYHRWQCKDCERIRTRNHMASRVDRAEKNRKYLHEVQHGLGPGGYDRMLEAQGGGCAICGSVEAGRRRKYLAVDHDHNHCPGRWGCSECIRGLLCGTCNIGLGAFKDNPELLEAAVEYLRTLR